ncbi:hypothetical protein CEUSTIGMA_g6979.t1 [Chlamydomonas eustigma]|uniref:MICOS complex subunit MIC60 n=1 Tax=Chlamydomonas eustigma TaxID=1157962 RepID=A0A250X8Y2_9CHLO|nr:hypothetical protein CEUSTIGMA_g6979.t1 [Chlamydomonas eustigma]|eukprot:GAX79538.1 hypothetical protein CEUSTIGMA_g6979.t1 [Chlamydomonas eustigma]
MVLLRAGLQRGSLLTNTTFLLRLFSGSSHSKDTSTNTSAGKISKQEASPPSSIPTSSSSTTTHKPLAKPNPQNHPVPPAPGLKSTSPPSPAPSTPAPPSSSSPPPSSASGTSVPHLSAEHPGKQSRFKLLGWIIPLLGIPTFAIITFQEQHRNDEMMDAIIKSAGLLKEEAGGKVEVVGDHVKAPTLKQPLPTSAALHTLSEAKDTAVAANIAAAVAAGEPSVVSSSVATANIAAATASPQSSGSGVKSAELEEVSTAGVEIPASSPASLVASTAILTAVNASLVQDKVDELASEILKATSAESAAAATPPAPPAPPAPPLTTAEHHASSPDSSAISSQLTADPAVTTSTTHADSFIQHSKVPEAPSHIQEEEVQGVFDMAMHEAEMKKAHQAVQEAEARTERIRKKAEETAERFRTLLRQHQEMAAEVRDIEVKQKEKSVMLKYNEAAIEERKQRMIILDDIRLQLGALSQAHEFRQLMQERAHSSHTLALGILGLTAAMEATSGLVPLAPHVAALSGVYEHQEGRLGQKDEVVAAAVASLPSSAITQGVPSRSELEAEFRRTRGVLSHLSYFPAGAAAAAAAGSNDFSSPAAESSHTSGGILAHAVARFATWLKVDETAATLALSGSDGVDYKCGMDSYLAKAELALSSGRLLEAAATIEAATEGTAAAAAAAPWVDAVRCRAAADQALQLLRAHATVLASSLTA